MSDNLNEASLKKAISCLTFHFTEHDGLVAQLERGLGIDEADVHAIEQAIQRLHQAWENENLVPKQVVQLFWRVFPRIESCLHLYPDKRDEISAFLVKLSTWLEIPFTTPTTMSEDHAIAVVGQHLIGPSFLVEVLHFGTIDEHAVEELFFAINTLSEVWSQRTYISKFAAGALISTQDIFSGYGPFSQVLARFSDDKKEQLRKIEQRLLERVDACLG